MEEPGLVAEIYREALDLSPRDREMLIVALKHSLEDEGHPTTAHSITV
jgi:hypothetical protein